MCKSHDHFVGLLMSEGNFLCGGYRKCQRNYLVYKGAATIFVKLFYYKIGLDLVLLFLTVPFSNYFVTFSLCFSIRLGNLFVFFSLVCCFMFLSNVF